MRAPSERRGRRRRRAMAEAALLVLVAAAAAGAVARAAPPVPDAGLLALQLGAGAGAGSGAHEAEDAPLESQQGILLHDRPAWGLEQEGGPNEPLGAMKSAAWARPLDLPVPLPPPPPALAGAEGMAGVGVGVGVGMGARATMRRLPRYRARKGPPLDRRRKLKVLRRQDPMAASRALADQPDVYVVDETVTGYAPEAGEGPGALAPLLPPLPPLPPLAPLHVAPDAALLAGAWLDDDDALHVRHRLQKLDFYFQLLRILSEDCRQRVLCEVAREPERFSPLAAVLGEVTSFSGSYQYVTSHLINTTEGARLLSYMEASFRGQDRARSCAVFQYRCPSRTEDMINYDALCLWREMVRWLTIHVVARPP